MSSKKGSSTANKRHRKNPRGQGGKLREEIVDAADALWAELGDARKLSLRGVARKVGIAATSIYLHFPDIEHLLAAVAERHFDELSETLRAAGKGVSDPAEVLLTRCRAYCCFALDHPDHYRVLFEAERQDLAPSTSYDLETSPGRRALDSLIKDIERCWQVGMASANGDSFRLAVLVWVALHGLVSLRISRPRFPWPPLDEMADEVVGRLVGLNRQVGD